MVSDPVLIFSDRANSIYSHSPEYTIREIFVKARQLTRCLLIFEDLDSLITDRAKSFFLDTVDGFESNEKIMMLGSTNYLERLDAGISKRPGRFDRKYHFVLPALPERVKYCDYLTGDPSFPTT